MPCRFCCCEEPGYRPPPYTDFICSRCVQLLLAAGQEKLKGACSMAVQRGYANKASVIECFLEENPDERKAKKFKRNLVRKRPVRSVRPSRDKIRP